MIPFDEIDRRLAGIGKDRKWLSQATGRSAGAIRSALAPKASPQHRSELLQKALTNAIEMEEATQASKAETDDADRRLAALREGPALILQPSEEEFHQWEQAALEQDMTLSQWVNWAIDEFRKSTADTPAPTSGKPRKP